MSESYQNSYYNNDDNNFAVRNPVLKKNAAFPFQDYTTCENCILKNDCELDKAKEKKCTFNRLVDTILCGTKNVAAGIGDDFKIDLSYDYKIETYNTDFVEKWEPRRPVYISAQTGQGKNYFLVGEKPPAVPGVKA